jgi:sulfatase maturation enzyme AslB (radical SAM superfamily)
MKMEDFKNYVNSCVEAGIVEFELSPLVGEALFDKDIFKRVEFLNSVDKVKTIFFFTNMLKLTPEILQLSKKFKKFGFKLSVYGSNQAQYKKRTGVDVFDKMLESIKFILNEQPRILEIDLRYDRLPAIEEDTRYRALTKVLFDRYPNVAWASEDVNWTTSLMAVTTTLADPPVDRSHEVKKGHSCPFLELDIGVWPDGDVGICSCWFDINKKMILGNLNTDSAEVILKRVGKYKEEQKSGLFRSLCSACTYPLRDLGSKTPGRIHLE